MRHDPGVIRSHDSGRSSTRRPGSRTRGVGRGVGLGVPARPEAARGSVSWRCSRTCRGRHLPRPPAQSPSAPTATRPNGRCCDRRQLCFRWCRHPHHRLPRRRRLRCRSYQHRSCRPGHRPCLGPARSCQRSQNFGDRVLDRASASKERAAGTGSGRNCRTARSFNGSIGGETRSGGFGGVGGVW